MRLKLLHHLRTIVYQREACALPTTVLCSEAKAGNLVFVGFIEFSELLSEFIF